MFVTASLQNITVDETQKKAIKGYAGLLIHYNKAYALVSRKNTEREILKQFFDILALHIFLPEFGELIDTGAGAGFVGIIMAILRPHSLCYLVERSKKKALVLTLMSTRLGLGNVTILAKDLFEFKKESDILVSKASTVSDKIAPNLPQFLKMGGKYVVFSQDKRDAPFRNFPLWNPFRDRMTYISVMERLI